MKESLVAQESRHHKQVSRGVIHSVALFLSIELVRYLAQEVLVSQPDCGEHKDFIQKYLYYCVLRAIS